MIAHRAAVTFTGGRYGYTPTCSCGWVTRGYVEIARDMLGLRRDA